MTKMDLAISGAASVQGKTVSRDMTAKSPRSFKPKPDAKIEDLRVVFDDTCSRYPKTLARLAE